MSDGQTTITVDSDAKARLAAQKPESSTWSEFLLDLLEDGESNCDCADQLEEQLLAVEQQIEDLPTRVTESLRSELR